MDPDRNNLETFINITVQFYITQVYITYRLAWVDILYQHKIEPFWSKFNEKYWKAKFAFSMMGGWERGKSNIDSIQQQPYDGCD